MNGEEQAQFQDAEMEEGMHFLLAPTGNRFKTFVISFCYRRSKVRSNFSLHRNQLQSAQRESVVASLLRAKSAVENHDHAQNQSGTGQAATKVTRFLSAMQRREREFNLELLCNGRAEVVVSKGGRRTFFQK